MTYEEVRQTLGTQVEIAKALGVRQSQVSQWKRKGIPLQRQWQIQLVTGGRLQAQALKVGAGGSA